MWKDARELARTVDAASVEEAKPAAMEGLLRDLPTDAQDRLDDVLARPRRGRGRRPYAVRLPEPVEEPEPPRVTPRRRNSKPGVAGLHDKIIAALRADPQRRYGEIAADLDCSRKYVGVLAREHGLSRGVRGRPAAPKRPAVPKRKVSRVQARQRQSPRQAVYTLADAGIGPITIAARLDVAVATVNYYLRTRRVRGAPTAPRPMANRWLP